MALDGAKFVCLDENDVLLDEGAATPFASAASTAADNDNGDGGGDGGSGIGGGCGSGSSADVGVGCVVVKPNGRKFTVGYYMNCDYVLDDHRAKGVHCEIQCDAFGRVTIHNLSEEHPISVNDQIINIKRPLLHGSRITILNKNFLWQFPKSTEPIGAANIECIELLSDDDDTTPQKMCGCGPEQPPTSCPDLKLHRNVVKRFTVHNFAYCIQSNDEGNTSLESPVAGTSSKEEPSNDSKRQAESEDTKELTHQTDLPTSTTTVDNNSGDQNKKRRSITPEPTTTTNTSSINLEETPKMNLINCTQNKENKSTEKKQILLSLCNQSDIVITSFSPRETGVRIEKSFTAILKPASKLAAATTTPKSVYSTPKSILSESNDEFSHDFIDFTTPATSKKALELRRAKNSSMHLIDLTTPTKLAPASSRSQSAMKPVTKRNPLTDVSSSQKSATIDLIEDGISLLPATPVLTQKEVDSPPSSGTESVISVDGSTDTSSVIEISAEESTPRLGPALGMSAKTPQTTVNQKAVTTPMRTPQSLMKRALLTSAKKQLSGARNTPAAKAISVSIGRSRARLQEAGVGAATPTTPKPLLGSPSAAAVLAQRRSLTAPVRRSLIREKLKFDNSPASTSLTGTKLNYTGSRMISTSTPVRPRAGLGTSLSVLRAGTRKSPLHGVRKSFGSTTLPSHISKSRKSMPSGAANARTRRLVAAAITKSNLKDVDQIVSDNAETSLESKPIMVQLQECKGAEDTEANSDELSRTFTVDNSTTDAELGKTEEKCKDTTFSPIKNIDEKEVSELNKTYSPEKIQATSTAELAEIPIDVAEVNSSTPQKPIRQTANEKQQTDKCAALEDKQDREMISESFAEVVVDLTEGNNINSVDLKICEDKKHVNTEIGESTEQSQSQSQSIAAADEPVPVITNKQENEVETLAKSVETETADINATIILDTVATSVKQETDANVNVEGKTQTVGVSGHDLAETAVSSTEFVLDVKTTSDKADLKYAEVNVDDNLDSGNDGAATGPESNEDITTEQIEIPSSPITTEVISGESEGTAELLEEIEYVLNKSDELKQRQISKELAEEERKLSNVTSLDPLEEDKKTIDDCDIVNVLAVEKTASANDTEKEAVVVTEPTSIIPSHTETCEAVNSEAITKEFTEAPNGVNTALLEHPVELVDEFETADLKACSNDEMEDVPTSLEDIIETPTSTETFTADDEKENKNSTSEEVLSPKILNAIEPKTPNLCGVREMLRTPKATESCTPHFVGLRNLMRSPKSTKVDTASEVEIFEAAQSLLRTPHPSKKAELLATLEESPSTSQAETVAFTPRRSARRRASATAEMTPTNASVTPRRSARRRASLSVEITPTSAALTPRPTTRRRASASAETCPYTPKRITSRRPSLSLDDDAAIATLTPHMRNVRGKCTTMLAECGEEMGAIIEEEPKDEKDISLSVQEDDKTGFEMIEKTVSKESGNAPFTELDIIEENICEEIGTEKIKLQEGVETIIGKKKTELLSNSAPTELTEVLDVMLTEELPIEESEEIQLQEVANQSLEKEEKDNLNGTMIVPANDTEESDNKEEVEHDSDIHDESDYEYGKEVIQIDVAKIADATKNDAASTADQQKTPKSSKTLEKNIWKDSEKTPIMLGVRELLRTPKLDIATPKLVGVRELVHTPKSSRRLVQGDDEDKFEGLSELVKTPKTELKTKIEIKEEEEPPSTSAEARLMFSGMRELLQTPKHTSTPHLKGVRELMQTPKANSTPQLGGIKRLLETPLAQVPKDEKELIVSNAIELNVTATGDNLEKIFRTPRGKDMMIPGLPASAVLEKNMDSVELTTTTEYDLNNSQSQCETENLEDIFQTPVSTHQMRSITDSPVENTIAVQNEQDEEIIVPETPANNIDTSSGKRNLSAEQAFDEMVGQVSSLEKTPPQKVYTHTRKIPKVQPSPFSAMDVISDLPKTDVQEWLDNIQTTKASPEAADYQSDEKCDIDEQEVTITESMLAQDIVSATSDPIADSIAEPSVNQKDTLHNVTEDLVNVSTVSSAVDPLRVSTSKIETIELGSADKDEEETIERPSTPADTEMSGINLLDQTNESEFSEPLVLSDSDSVVETLNEAEQSIVEVDRSLEKDFPIMIVDSDSEVSDKELEYSTTKAVEQKVETSNETATADVSCLETTTRIEHENKLEIQEEFKHFQSHHILRSQRSSTPNQHKARAKISRKTLGAEEDLQVTIDLQHEKSIIEKAKRNATNCKNLNVEESSNNDTLAEVTELSEAKNVTKQQSAELEAEKYDAEDKSDIPDKTTLGIASIEVGYSAETVALEIDENAAHTSEHEVNKSDDAQETSEKHLSAVEDVKEITTEEHEALITKTEQITHAESAAKIEDNPEQLTVQDEQVTDECIVEPEKVTDHKNSEKESNNENVTDAENIAELAEEQQAKESEIKSVTLKIDTAVQQENEEREGVEEELPAKEDAAAAEVEETENTEILPEHINVVVDAIEGSTEIIANVQSAAEGNETTKEGTTKEESLFVTKQNECENSQQESLKDLQNVNEIADESAVDAVKITDETSTTAQAASDDNIVNANMQIEQPNSILTQGKHESVCTKQEDTRVEVVEIHTPIDEDISLVEIKEITTSVQQSVIENNDNAVNEAETEDISSTEVGLQEVTRTEQDVLEILTEDTANEKSGIVVSQIDQESLIRKCEEDRVSHSKQEDIECKTIEIDTPIKENAAEVETHNEMINQEEAAKQDIIDLTLLTEELSEPKHKLRGRKSSRCQQHESTEAIVDQQMKTQEETPVEEVETIDATTNIEQIAASNDVEKLEKEEVTLPDRSESQGSCPQQDDAEVNKTQTFTPIEEDATDVEIQNEICSINAVETAAHTATANDAIVELEVKQITMPRLRGRKGSNSSKQQATNIDAVKASLVTPIEETEASEVENIKEVTTATTSQHQGSLPLESAAVEDDKTTNELSDLQHRTIEIDTIATDNVETEVTQITKPNIRGRKGSHSQQRQDIITEESGVIQSLATPVDDVVVEAKIINATANLEKEIDLPKHKGRKGLRYKQQDEATSISDDVTENSVEEGTVGEALSEAAENQNEEVESPQYEIISSTESNEAENSVSDINTQNTPAEESNTEKSDQIETAQASMPTRRGRKGSRSKQKIELADIKDDVIEEENVTEAVIEMAKNKDEEFESPQYEIISSTESNEAENTVMEINPENMLAKQSVAKVGAEIEEAQVSLPTRRGRKGSRSKQKVETAIMEEDNVAATVIEAAENKDAEVESPQYEIISSTESNEAENSVSDVYTEKVASKQSFIGKSTAVKDSAEVEAAPASMSTRRGRSKRQQVMESTSEELETLNELPREATLIEEQTELSAEATAVAEPVVISVNYEIEIPDQTESESVNESEEKTDDSETKSRPTSQSSADVNTESKVQFEMILEDITIEEPVLTVVTDQEEEEEEVNKRLETGTAIEDIEAEDRVKSIAELTAQAIVGLEHVENINSTEETKSGRRTRKGSQSSQCSTSDEYATTSRRRGGRRKAETPIEIISDEASNSEAATTAPKRRRGQKRAETVLEDIEESQATNVTAGMPIVDENPQEEEAKKEPTPHTEDEESQKPEIITNESPDAIEMPQEVELREEVIVKRGRRKQTISESSQSSLVAGRSDTTTRRRRGRKVAEENKDTTDVTTKLNAVNISSNDDGESANAIAEDNIIGIAPTIAEVKIDGNVGNEKTTEVVKEENEAHVPESSSRAIRGKRTRKSSEGLIHEIEKKTDPMHEPVQEAEKRPISRTRNNRRRKVETSTKEEIVESGEVQQSEQVVNAAITNKNKPGAAETDDEQVAADKVVNRKRRGAAAVAVSAMVEAATSKRGVRGRGKQESKPNSDTKSTEENPKIAAQPPDEQTQEVHDVEVKRKERKRRVSVHKEIAPAEDTSTETNENVATQQLVTSKRTRKRKESHAESETMPPQSSTDIPTDEPTSVTPKPEAKQTRRKRKESHTDDTKDTTQSDEPPSKRILTKSETTDLEAVLNSSQQSVQLEADGSNTSNMSTPQRMRMRNIPRRAVAAQDHNYDESSDGEAQSDLKRRIEKASLPKSNTEVKPSVPTVEVVTTSRGRTRKPTARVQQYLEEERAKAETPKKRVLLAGSNQTPASQTRPTPVRRGHKASTIDTDVPNTPQVAKRGRGRTLQTVQTTETSEESRSEIEHPSELELAQSTHVVEKEVEETVVAASKGGKRQPRKAKIEHQSKDNAGEIMVSGEKQELQVAANAPIRRGAKTAAPPAVANAEAATQVTRRARVRRGQEEAKETTDEHQTEEEEKPSTAKSARAARGGRKNKRTQQLDAAEHDAETSIDSETLQQEQQQQLLQAEKSDALLICADADDEEEDKPLAEVVVKTTVMKRTVATRRAANTSTDSPAPKRGRRKPVAEQQTEQVIGDEAAAAQVITSGRGRKVVRFVPSDVAQPSTTVAAVVSAESDAVAAAAAAPMSVAPEPVAAASSKRVTRARRK